MKTTLYIIILAFAITACKKDPLEFTIKGKVTDMTFAQGLSDASVKLYATNAGTADSKLLSSSTTNSAGEYSFTFERDKYESFNLLIEKQNYFTLDEVIPFSNLTTEEDNTFNYNTTAESWLKFRVQNTGSTQPSDESKIYKTAGKVNCNECCPLGFSFFYGDIDTTFYCANDGNTNYDFQYFIVHTGQNSTESILTPAFDTTEFVISY